MILLSSVWVLLLVIVFNVTIYFYILRNSTTAETKLLWNKAQIILRNPYSRQPDNWGDPDLLAEYNEPDMLVRIIDTEGVIRASVSTSDRLAAYPVSYKSGYGSAMVNEFGVRMLFVQVPIRAHGYQLGTLELGKSLNVMSEWLKLLGTGLYMTSGAVLVVALVSGYFYTRVLIRPIGELLDTMNEIRKKRYFVTLSPRYASAKDELGRLGQTFNDMIETLKEQDARQKQFVADASHELRTPLTVIESYASLLSRWGGERPEVREEAIQAIQSESVRLKGLIHSLLRQAEFERGEELPKQPVSLIPLLQETAGRLAMAFRREIRLDVSEGAEPVCLGSEEQLKQLLIILLDNAVSYSDGPVLIGCREQGREIVLTVADQGIGIPEEDIPHLFERFYRVDKTRQRRSGGSGLGLSIAKQIVDRHNGTISIQSGSGAGTQVEITLPRAIF
ncbi:MULTISPECIES: cell wall metabolism sensor histidine kinase WalK [unclassified Paenibacillus]|uniref:sensor histidine kinase n=1 Tax=unclassified Paenibacillus TaxID=185978 RepID=UPI001C40AB13|nr:MULTISPECIES: HAMP domain-containing sensor histidine kinase [unclassified Paenibacillus]